MNPFTSQCTTIAYKEVVFFRFLSECCHMIKQCERPQIYVKINAYQMLGCVKGQPDK